MFWKKQQERDGTILNIGFPVLLVGTAEGEGGRAATSCCCPPHGNHHHRHHHRYHHSTHPTFDRNAPPPGTLQDLFRKLDTDESGSISFAELSAGLRQQGYILNDNEVAQLMRKVGGQAGVGLYSLYRT